MFISIEGGEGVGKTTLIHALQAQHPEFVYLREPGDTPAGEAIRHLLLEQDYSAHLALRTQALLFAASRMQLNHEKIIPALQAGKVVVTDRYLSSNLVYQGLVGGLPLTYLQQINAGIRLPDHTFCLDLAPRRAQARIQQHQRATNFFDHKNLAYQERIRAGFLQLAQFNDKYTVLEVADLTLSQQLEVILSFIKPTSSAD